jgi:hypothetical protein
VINEREEFLAYTEQPVYSTQNKRDTTYMGRFTFDMLLDFEGLSRVLTIVARGYMWQSNEPDIERATGALRAWCSVPDSKKASPKEDWQYQTQFSDLHGEFPELVDEQGAGWFCRHVHCICDFVKANPDVTSKPAQEHCKKLSRGFNDAWRNKVLQFQTPIFSPTTRGAWVLRFDDILADAKEQGRLRDRVIFLSSAVKQIISADTPEDVPTEGVELLVRYYYANKQEDNEWVVLPVTNFDAYFGNTNFSRKWWNRVPDSIIMKQKQCYGVCRYSLRETIKAANEK